jgi:hypothetical protein
MVIVFSDVTACCLADRTNVKEELSASTFRKEETAFSPDL